MTEQPPSAEALSLAILGEQDLSTETIAREIDALCEQRVSAEIEWCALAARGGDHFQCGHGEGYMDGRLDAEAAIRATAERPARPVCKRCKDRGYINCV